MSKNNQPQKTTPVDLFPQEEELIRLMREKFRFGEIVVVMHDGLPRRIKETVRYQSLEG